MEMQLLKRFRHGLQETRDSLSAFLNSTPADKKAIHLGPSTEAAVRRRLDVIDHAISKADAGTIGKCTACHGDVEPVLLEVDYTARVCIEHFSAQERRQLENELNLARDIQKMLLPPGAAADSRFRGRRLQPAESNRRRRLFRFRPVWKRQPRSGDGRRGGSRGFGEFVDGQRAGVFADPGADEQLACRSGPTDP
ncbi:MAG: hypothetical protein WAL90_02615 [Desulfobacterales bacterium]